MNYHTKYKLFYSIIANYLSFIDMKYIIIQLSFVLLFLYYFRFFRLLFTFKNKIQIK